MPSQPYNQVDDKLAILLEIRAGLSTVLDHLQSGETLSASDLVKDLRKLADIYLSKLDKNSSAAE
jgi:hypothetical protein